jgi:predicted metal-dependent hydrolase
MPRGTVRALSFQQDRKVTALGAPVEVRRHPSARRMTLKVSHTRRAIILTVPNGVRLEEAGNFLARHIEWVRDKLGEVPDARCLCAASCTASASLASTAPPTRTSVA